MGPLKADVECSELLRNSRIQPKINSGYNFYQTAAHYTYDGSRRLMLLHIESKLAHVGKYISGENIEHRQDQHSKSNPRYGFRRSETLVGLVQYIFVVSQD